MKKTRKNVRATMTIYVEADVPAEWNEVKVQEFLEFGMDFKDERVEKEFGRDWTIQEIDNWNTEFDSDEDEENINPIADAFYCPQS